ncbi:hypothetical protein B296_00041890 [Ensete ventricosum]|uniref:Uncharacterized protein n=1 Tax=Ensete ventricosum TaxID=4639 RepID=A0A426XC19_ENSVE|nr:hypothetical protein B296_00041890 [Ensete ventricosum]
MAACSSGTAKWKLPEGKRKRPNQRYSFAAASDLQKQAKKLEGAKTGTARVDRRPGKRPLPPDEPEQKEGDQQQAVSHFAPSRADHDASAMVSALSHVISSTSSVLDTRGGEPAPTQQGIKLEAAGPGDTEATQVSEEQGMP